VSVIEAESGRGQPTHLVTCPVGDAWESLPVHHVIRLPLVPSAMGQLRWIIPGASLETVAVNCSAASDERVVETNPIVRITMLMRTQREK
jgi:hypothetical protein